MATKKPSPNSRRVIYAAATKAARQVRIAGHAALERDAEHEASMRAGAFGRAYAAAALSTMDLTEGLISEAFVFLEKGSAESEWRIAVIIAHAACDVQTGRTLEELAQRRPAKAGEKSPLHGLARNAAFSQKDTRKVYTKLSGDDLESATWWNDWDASVDRRNDVAHRGARMTRKQASDSYEACRLMVAHLKAQLAGARQ